MLGELLTLTLGQFFLVYVVGHFGPYMTCSLNSLQEGFIKDYYRGY